MRKVMMAYRVGSGAFEKPHSRCGLLTSLSTATAFSTEEDSSHKIVVAAFYLSSFTSPRGSAIDSFPSAVCARKYGVNFDTSVCQ